MRVDLIKPYRYTSRGVRRSVADRYAPGPHRREGEPENPPSYTAPAPGAGLRPPPSPGAVTAGEHRPGPRFEAQPGLFRRPPEPEPVGPALARPPASAGPLTRTAPQPPPGITASGGAPRLGAPGAVAPRAGTSWREQGVRRGAAPRESAAAGQGLWTEYLGSQTPPTSVGSVGGPLWDVPTGEHPRNEDEAFASVNAIDEARRLAHIARAARLTEMQERPASAPAGLSAASAAPGMRFSGGIDPNRLSAAAQAALAQAGSAAPVDAEEDDEGGVPVGTEPAAAFGSSASALFGGPSGPTDEEREDGWVDAGEKSVVDDVAKWRKDALAEGNADDVVVEFDGFRITRGQLARMLALGWRVAYDEDGQPEGLVRGSSAAHFDDLDDEEEWAPLWRELEEDERRKKAEAKTAEQEGAATKRLNEAVSGLLDKEAVPTIDEAAFERRIQADRARRAFETARAMRAALEAQARSGASAEYSAGTSATMAHGAEMEGQSADAQQRLAVEMANLESRRDFYRTRSAALMTLAQSALNAEDRMRIFEQAREQARLAELSQMRLLEYQQRLNEPTWEDVGFGLLGTLAGGLGSGLGYGIGSLFGGGGK